MARQQPSARRSICDYWIDFFDFLFPSNSRFCKQKTKNGRCAKKSSPVQSASPSAFSAQSLRGGALCEGAGQLTVYLDHPACSLFAPKLFQQCIQCEGCNRGVLPPSLMVFSKVVHTLPFYCHIICSFLTVLNTPPTILLLPSIPQVQEGAEGRGGVGSAQHGNGGSGPVLQKSLPY